MNKATYTVQTSLNLKSRKRIKEEMTDIRLRLYLSLPRFRGATTVDKKFTLEMF